MRYFVRAVKYFIYFSAIFALILLVLVLLGLAGDDQGGILRNGWKSVGEIAFLFGAVAAFYPKLGFTTRTVDTEGAAGDVRGSIMKVMESKGYRLESEDGEDLAFRLRNRLNAISRMFEDRITFKKTGSLLQVEGLTKDVVRVAGSLEYSLKKEE